MEDVKTVVVVIVVHAGTARSETKDLDAMV